MTKSVIRATTGGVEVLKCFAQIGRPFSSTFDVLQTMPWGSRRIAMEIDIESCSRQWKSIENVWLKCIKVVGGDIQRLTNYPVAGQNPTFKLPNCRQFRLESKYLLFIHYDWYCFGFWKCSRTFFDCIGFKSFALLSKLHTKREFCC